MHALAGPPRSATRYQQGFKNNYHGGRAVRGEQAFSLFGGGARDFQEQRWMDTQNAPGSKTPGVGFMAVTDENGNVLTGADAKRAKVTHDGRDYVPDPTTGTLRYVQTSTYLPAIRNFQEHQQRLNAIASFCAGGDQVAESVFGAGFLEECMVHDGPQDVKGHVITPSLAKVDCTPSLLFQLPGETKEFALGFAKLKQVVDAFGIIPLGPLPSFDEPAQGGAAHDVNLIGDQEKERRPAKDKGVVQEM